MNGTANLDELNALFKLQQHGFRAYGDLKTGFVTVFLSEGGDSSYCGSYANFLTAAACLCPAN